MYEALVVDDNRELQERLRRMLKHSELVLTNSRSSMFDPKSTNFTPDREHGWYRQFEKNSKKHNFKKVI